MIKMLKSQNKLDQLNCVPTSSSLFTKSIKSLQINIPHKIRKIKVINQSNDDQFINPLKQKKCFQHQLKFNENKQNQNKRLTNFSEQFPSDKALSRCCSVKSTFSEYKYSRASSRSKETTKKRKIPKNQLALRDFISINVSPVFSGVKEIYQ